MPITKVTYSMIDGAVVNIADYGAVGDGSTDDSDAIQAAIDSVSVTDAANAVGGGTVYIPPGKFRITKTLLIGYGVTIQGVGGGGYPFVSSTSQMSEIYVDFGASVNQWAFDSATYQTSGGQRFAYDAWANASVDTDYNSLHNVAIKNLIIRDANEALQTNVPWGAIRLIGCPNAIIDGVSILGFGIGIQLNTCFGTSITRTTGMTNYYGLMCYNANNAIVVQAQFDKIISPSNLTVPVGRIPSWMPSAAAFTGTSFYMNGSHYQSSKGITIAATQAIGSNGATVNFLGQYWGDVSFLYNSYATTFTLLYAEGATTENVIASCYASYTALNVQNYTNNASCVIDAGYQTIGEINVGGNNLSTVFARNIWGSGSPADPTNVIVHNNSQGAGIQLVPRLNFAYWQSPWTPTVTSGTGTITTVGAVTGIYTLNAGLCTVQFDITITTNGTGATSIILSNLPYAPANVPVGFSYYSAGVGRNTSTNKALHVTGQPGSYSLTVYNYDGTYPAGSGERLIGTISYAISY